MANKTLIACGIVWILFALTSIQANDPIKMSSEVVVSSEPRRLVLTPLQEAQIKRYEELLEFWKMRTAAGVRGGDQMIKRYEERLQSYKLSLESRR